MGVLDQLRRGRWLGFTLFAVLMVALCVVLSHWQWNRYQTRQAENRALDAAVSAPATPISELVSPAPLAAAQPLDPALTWRMVTATGTFDRAGEVAVRRRPLDGRNGFWIVTPLVTDSGIVLVNRGWAPAEGLDATSSPSVPAPPAGPVEVTGRLRPAEVDTHDEAPPPDQAWAVDPAEILAGTTDPVYGPYIELRSSAPDAAEGLVLLSDPGHRGWNNLVYTVQWLLFGLVAAIGWWRLLKAQGEPLPAADRAAPSERDVLEAEAGAASVDPAPSTPARSDATGPDPRP